jgi:hypothetical protein
MNVRILVPGSGKQQYAVTYRCPRCGTDRQREFTQEDRGSLR